MDQKTRVAVKYRSNVGHGYYFGVFIDRRLRHPLLFTPFLGLFLALKFVEHGFTPSDGTEAKTSR